MGECHCMHCEMTEEHQEYLAEEYDKQQAKEAATLSQPNNDERGE